MTSRWLQLALIAALLLVAGLRRERVDTLARGEAMLMVPDRALRKLRETRHAWRARAVLETPPARPRSKTCQPKTWRAGFPIRV